MKFEIVSDFDIRISDFTLQPGKLTRLVLRGPLVLSYDEPLESVQNPEVPRPGFKTQAFPQRNTALFENGGDAWFHVLASVRKF
ncbi:MAG: hypothetical protein H7Z17_14800 [Fuerstia sp.]|nr:hypothetical protein [Fuerstiella sp.]